MGDNEDDFDDYQDGGSDGDYTEVTEQGWLSRLMGSIKSVGIGFLLFFAAFGVLFWNEGRTVKTARDLAEGKGKVVTVKARAIQSKNAGKLVHLIGKTAVRKAVKDKAFKIKRKSLRLLRKVEMYQWKEIKKTRSKKKVGGKKVKITSYSYKRQWSSTYIDSENFNRRGVKRWARKNDVYISNPIMQLKSRGPFNNKTATIGAFSLPRKMLGQLTAWQPVKIKKKKFKKILKAIAKLTRRKAKKVEDKIFLGDNPEEPQVGDYQVAIQEIKNQTVSLIAKQVGSSFEAYVGSSGTPIYMLQPGSISADKMFQAAASANKTMGWVLRLVGFLMMAAGLYMIFSPLVIIADVIPFLGSMLSFGIGFFAAIFAAFFSLITMSIAWLFYRPITAIIMIAVAVGLAFALKMLSAKKKSSSAATESSDALEDD